MNVRAGNACWLELPENMIAVVDWGTTDKAMRSALVNRAIESNGVAFLLATHAHSDHTSGLPGLLQDLLAAGVPVGAIYSSVSLPKISPGDDPAATRRTDYLRRLAEIALPHPEIEQAQVTIRESRWTSETRLWTSEDERVDVLAVAPSCTVARRQDLLGYANRNTPNNSTSIVVWVRNLDTGRSLLLPGDAEKETLAFAKRHCTQVLDTELTSDVLIVPHHGSTHNWNEEVAGLCTGLFVLSSPPGSDHHPAESVLSEIVERCKVGDAKNLACTGLAACCERRILQQRSNIAQHGSLKRAACCGDITVTMSNRIRVSFSNAMSSHYRSNGVCQTAEN